MHTVGVDGAPVVLAAHCLAGPALGAGGVAAHSVRAQHLAGAAYGFGSDLNIYRRAW
jgi:hypothetical protein